MVVNYIFVITWFPAMIIMKEKKMFPYWIPAYCGCCIVCLPLSFFKYKSYAGRLPWESDDAVEDAKKNQEADAPDEINDDPLARMTKLERWFYDVYAPALDKAKIPVVIVGSIITIIFFAFAIQLKPSEEAAQFLPSSDPIQRNIDLGANPEIKVFNANAQQMCVTTSLGLAAFAITLACQISLTYAVPMLLQRPQRYVLLVLFAVLMFDFWD